MRLYVKRRFRTRTLGEKAFKWPGCPYMSSDAVGAGTDLEYKLLFVRPGSTSSVTYKRLCAVPYSISTDVNAAFQT